MYDYKRFGGDTYPAPFADLEVFAADGELESLTVGAALDTGADITAVPAKMLRELSAKLPGGLTRTRTILVYTPIGQQAQPVFLIRARFGECSFERHEVVTFEHLSFAIIGRDILNNFKLTLNAPQGSWDIDPKTGSWTMNGNGNPT